MALLIFQDIAVVPLMLLTPYLSADSDGLDLIFFLTILKGILTVIAVAVVGRAVAGIPHVREVRRIAPRAAPQHPISTCGRACGIDQ